jgi:small neutral amino acid transporter SnatA (MarC family)
MLIDTSTLAGDIVLDYTAMTGEASSIHCGLLLWFIAYGMRLVCEPGAGSRIKESGEQGLS